MHRTRRALWSLLLILSLTAPLAAATRSAFAAGRAVPAQLAAAGDILYLSPATSGTAGGVAYDNEDILAYNAGTGAWSLYFDGSDVGLAGVNVDAFDRRPDGSLLLSVDAAANLPGTGWVAGADIVRFTPTSLGPTTAGSFSWYFDGSDVGLDVNSENVDALAFAPDGRLLVSVLGSIVAPGIAANDEDLLAFTATQTGDTTAGSWSMYFDGSDAGLSTTADEDLDGAWIDPASGQVYLNTLGAFAAGSLTGDGADIFICTPGSLGDTTTCTYGPGLYWDASQAGFSGLVDDLDISLGSGGQGSTATPSPTATRTPTATATQPAATATRTPTATATQPAATATRTPTSLPTTPTWTPTPTFTSQPTQTPAPTSTPSSGSGSDRIYLSSTTSGSVGGVDFESKDILAYDSASGSWSMFFDASDVAPGTYNLTDFELQPDGSLLFSIYPTASLPGVGWVDDSDIIRFIPITYGDATDGTFEWYFDGSDVGLDGKGEVLDAFAVAPDGRLILSIIGAADIPNLSVADEDLLAFTPSQLGDTTAGSWSIYFDGSDVGLSTTSEEDINAAWIDPNSGKIYLSVMGAFAAGNVMGDGSDIFICTPNSLGDTTACDYGSGLYWVGSAHGFAEDTDGLAVVLSAPAPPPPPTPCPTGPVRVMPLGDSITDGTGSTDSNGYRRRLFLELQGDGYSVNFVGSLQNGLADFDRDHEGHGGWYAEGGQGGGIAPNIYNWLSANPADVVLLHIGTNDISNNDQNPADVAHILDEIDRFNPNIPVILALIINRKTNSPATTQYNADVQAMAQARIAAGDRITIVDMEHALDYAADMADNVHPNNGGYFKMAEVWRAALKGLVGVCR